jgi:hypothetical protein
MTHLGRFKHTRRVRVPELRVSAMSPATAHHLMSDIDLRTFGMRIPWDGYKRIMSNRYAHPSWRGAQTTLAP